jgi:3-dehydroquinate synthase
MHFTFGEYKSDVHFQRNITRIDQIAADLCLSESEYSKILVIADENTSAIADAACSGFGINRIRLKSGEDSKMWDSVQMILSAALKAGIGRDGVFIGIGGGVTGDITGFAASVYMRGCRLVLVATTLLAMVDASLGGKTGFDLFGIKNLAGSFYPAEIVYMPLDCLASLPLFEWKSGMAELIKTAVLEGDDFFDEMEIIAASFPEGAFDSDFPDNFAAKMLAEERFGDCIRRAALFKGGIVMEDPKETGNRRMLLNLGHTFGHALEASAGLGMLSHGEAVAWGMACSAKLGYALGVTPRLRVEKIIKLISLFGYCHKAPHPLARGTDAFLAAMKSDKKKKSGKLTFIVPDTLGARLVVIETEKEMNAVIKVIEGESLL